jgi:hypothetical protein
VEVWPPPPQERQVRKTKKNETACFKIPFILPSYLPILERKSFVTSFDKSVNTVFQALAE